MGLSKKIPVLLVLIIVALTTVSCSVEPEKQLERASGLLTWEQKESAYKKVLENTDRPEITAKTLAALVEGYAEQNDLNTAIGYYTKLKSLAKSVDSPQPETEIIFMAAQSAGNIFRYYNHRMDYFKASKYLQEQILFLEQTGCNISDELLVLMDLHTKVCNFDEAFASYNKWFNLYGKSYPQLAVEVRNKILGKINSTEVYT
jgi:tetratricopeptide (TPR) repeat protein